MFADLVKEVESKLLKENPDITYDPNRPIKKYSSGSIIVDSITGGGIAVEGRLTELVGLEGSGKTTLCLQTCVQVLKEGGSAIYMDLEQGFDVDYARDLGLDLEQYKDRFAFFRPANIEETVNILNIAQKKNAIPNLLIIDSIAQLKPKKLLEAQGDQTALGLHARACGEFFSSLVSSWGLKKRVAILATNQYRRVPGMGSIFQAKAVKSGGIGAGTSNDDSWTTTGGQQIRYLMSMRIAMEHASKIEEGSYDNGDLNRIGNYVRMYVMKNRFAPPHQKAKLAIMYGKGTSDYLVMVETLKEQGYINYSGSWHYKDSKGSEYGTGLSIKIRKKEEFFQKIAEAEYVEDMKKTFLRIMGKDDSLNIQNAEIMEGQDEKPEGMEISFDDDTEEL